MDEFDEKFDEWASNVLDGDAWSKTSLRDAFFDGMKAGLSLAQDRLFGDQEGTNT